MVRDAAGGRAAREGALVWRCQQHCVNVSLGGVCLGTRVRKRWRVCATAMRLSTFGNDVEMAGDSRCALSVQIKNGRVVFKKDFKKDI